MLVFSLPLALGGTIYEATFSPTKGFVPPFWNEDANWLEPIPVPEVQVFEDGHTELVIDSEFDERDEPGTNDQCSTISSDIYTYLYRGTLSQNGDVDWFRGYKSGTNNIRFVLVPPKYKDYDMAIYDACNQLVGYCDGGSDGQIEFCYAQVTDYFYVQVYGFGGDYSSSEPYYIHAHNHGSDCDLILGSGRTDKSQYSCNDTIRVTNNLRNNSNYGIELNFYQDLWYPSTTYHDRFGPSGLSLGSGSNTDITAPFSPPQNGWPENGYYADRSFVFWHCSNNQVLGIDATNTNPYVNCTCQDECSYSGQKRCNGNNSETCGNYDQDSCLEWGNSQYCQYGCSNGQCNQCNSHSYSSCFDNDLYWYNSCGQREDKRQECGGDSYGGYYCLDDDVYQDVTYRGCESDACYERVIRRKISECGELGCSGGQCNSCQSHDHEGCFDNDVYWYNSCNEREERKEDCRVSCEYSQGDYFCNNGCLGKFAVTARNQQGGIEPNATISFKRPDMQDFAFAGLTNSEGKLNFSDLWTRGCGLWYDIKAVTANGGDCGVRSTFIEGEGDQDGVMFTCPIVNNDNFLRVAPDGPTKIRLGETLDLRALITDRYYSPVSAALVGVNRPYNDTPLSDTSDSQGNASFLDDSVPAGSHNFQFIASKVNYNYGEAWKRVTVEPQQASVQVRDEIGNPVWHAKILIENQIVGYTDNDGRLTVDVNEQINTFEARNTDDIHCGYRTIKIGEQANFICPESPLLRVDVDSNTGYAMSNVLVAIDGIVVDYTNVFGYVLTTVPSGERLVEIYYQLDVNGAKYFQQKTLDIHESQNILEFIADEENGIRIDGLSQKEYGIYPHCEVLCIGAIAVGMIVVIAAADAQEEFCSCVIEHNDNIPINLLACVNRLEEFNFKTEYEEKNIFRRHFIAENPCFPQYLNLGLFIVSPEEKLFNAGKPVVANAVKVLLDIPDVAKLIEVMRPAFKILEKKPVREGVDDYIAQEVTYRVVKTGPETFDRFYVIKNGQELSVKSTDILDEFAKLKPENEAYTLATKDILGEFGKYTDDLTDKRVKDLLHEVNELRVDRWTRNQKQGMHVITGKAPNGQSAVVILGMKGAGEWTDDMIKQITELDSRGDLKNVKFDQKPPNSEKILDWKATFEGRTDWIDSTTYKHPDTDVPLLLESPDQIWNTAYEKSAQFRDTEGLNTSLVIDVQIGRTENMTKEVIESTVREIYNDETQLLRNVKRVIFRDAVTKEVFVISKPGG